MTDEQMKQVEQMQPVMAVGCVGGALVLLPILLFLGAAVLWVIFTAILGTDLRYPHHLAVASNGALIWGLGWLLSVAIMLARGTMRSTLSLAAFVPREPETSLVYLVLSVFDFFMLWGLAAMGVMIARAGRRPAGSTVAILLALYLVPALGLAVLGGILGGLVVNVGK